jgi:hypothetical protein
MVPEESRVRLVVYSVLGAVVEELVDQEVRAGIHEAWWDARGHASGVYFIRMEATRLTGERIFMSSRRAVLVK